ncbi:MAG: ABC transporter ATP-binding protein [Gammaproteobacteria bacterium]
MASVALDHVRKVYDNGHVAVADATFAAGESELLVLVGPSGCGKSTTLRMIAGLETASSGTISIGDRLVNEVAPKDRDIAMVFQSYALYPHMTVFENLAFGLVLRRYSRSEVDRRVHEAAGVLGLEQMLERKPRQLSGGQRQRVALGRALVREPKAFLLDEPLSNLDAKLRSTMRTEIARLHRRLGTTMIYVTHDQIEAMTLGQRIVVFNHGEIQQIDTPLRLYGQPANVFVAGFLGSPAMNLFRGNLQRGDGPRLDLGKATLPLGTLPPEISARDGRELIVGLRPEDLHLAADSSQVRTAPVFTAMVDAVEPLGSDAFITARLGDVDVVARIHPTRLPEAGAAVTLSFTPGNLHFFDPVTEKRLNCA